MEIKNVCILGAGTLGSRVALQAAISGYQIGIFDIHEKALTDSFQVMKGILLQLEKAEKIQEPIEKILSRIHFTTEMDKAVNQADIINESVTEDLNIKLEVWRKIGEIAPKHTIFTTNTSYLLPSHLAEASGRAEKFCAFHFHDVFYARVVDIMPHPGTDPSLIPLLEDFGKSLNQVPVLVKKENPGYIFNSMLIALIGAAGKLLTGEVASIEDIDKSWMVNFHMPMGPFGILDSIGLDTAWHVTKSRKDTASKDFASLLKTYIDQGKLGEKSGAGFYYYPNPEYKRHDFLN
ncbi:3-hydroxyacyl-CoA dehydrogenase [Algoriphagus hitonicola]|uniref:3-hydroxyacyl-CoA dehydrogenase n=1 Tax=Algoriphagus hitonicola TaxID=435880 RepID=A0A1I2X957_9BACT|nr:3-hydroxyacyl-CoA dehydrogenase [Algoriphagus hitonicola]SFH10053.1 3-hydroxyacyl-CoA dehydrogenase [Algoriphagus hitonicola]